MLDNLNRLYNQVNNTQIAFYMKCEPTYINNSEHLVKTIAGAALLISQNKEFGAINVHVVDQIRRNVLGMGFKLSNGLIIDRNSYAQPVPTSTLAHEVGHVLGLVHTHLYFWMGDFKCLVECVSRTREWPLFNFCPTSSRWKKVCESTGDALRDTPADPNLEGNNSCDYTLGGTDPWGDSYTNPPPDTRNIMSYNGADECISRFSRLQIAVMLRTIQHEKTTIDISHWRDTRFTFDNYEPDNNPEMAMSRNITFGEIQERNFHQQYNNQIGGLDPYITQCDVDWVRFTPSCSGTFLVETSEMPGRTRANTRVTLFDATATNQLAQNDDISGTNLFSRLSYNFVAGQTYFIRVDNMSNNVTGYYRLQVGRMDIDHDDSPICTSRTLSITNLPAGASVTWSVSPSGIFSLSCTNCQQTTVSRITNGTATITATITACGGTQTISRTIFAGPPLAPTIAGLNYDRRCGTYVEASASSPGATNYIWNLNYGQATGEGDYFYQAPLVYNPMVGFTYYNYLSVQAQNACGLSDATTVSLTVGPVPQYCGGGNQLMLSPNPTSSTLTVEATNDHKFTKLRIVDKMGQVRKQFSYPPSKKATIDVSNLPPDVYRVLAWINNNWVAGSFIKQ